MLGWSWSWLTYQPPPLMRSVQTTRGRQFTHDTALTVRCAMPSDAAGKMKRIEIIDQKVPGQKHMFAPVLSGVPGQMTRCPCGFGAYDQVIVTAPIRIRVSSVVISASKFRDVSLFLLGETRI